MIGTLKKTQGAVKNKETALGIGAGAGRRELRSDTAAKGRGVVGRAPEAAKNSVRLHNGKETLEVGMDEVTIFSVVMTSSSASSVPLSSSNPTLAYCICCVIEYLLCALKTWR